MKIACRWMRVPLSPKVNMQTFGCQLVWPATASDCMTVIKRLSDAAAAVVFVSLTTITSSSCRVCLVATPPPAPTAQQRLQLLKHNNQPRPAPRPDMQRRHTSQAPPSPCPALPRPCCLLCVPRAFFSPTPVNQASGSLPSVQHTHNSATGTATAKPQLQPLYLNLKVS